jgi:Ca2+-binding RTX toxin-like protein
VTTPPPRTRPAVLLLGVAVAAAILLPAGADARPTCRGQRADIVGTAGPDAIVAPKHGKQVIVTGEGDDVIVGDRNADVICSGDGNDKIYAGDGKDYVDAGAGDDYVDTGNGRGRDVVRGGDGNDMIVSGAYPDNLFGDAGDDAIFGETGRDVIWGGEGNDWLDGGPGSDHVFGEPGNDTIMGNAGTDYLHGGSANDRIYGEIQDDYLFGDDGNDLLSGDQGSDHIYGGNGDDWMRGGTNEDTYDGGPGSDTISFATVMPPGPGGGITGVKVDLPDGFATTGGRGQDTIQGTENVLGSPYNDELIGVGGTVDGLTGDDHCEGFSQLLACGGQPAQLDIARVELTDGPDPGLIVVGSIGPVNESFAISVMSGGYQVYGTGPFDAEGGCQDLGNRAFCPAPSAPLSFVVAYGGEGDDYLNIGPGFPRTTTVDLDGGNGSDRVEGGDNNDNLYAGESGHDTLMGHAGADALISGPGSDVLLGGLGNDQLVTTTPCDGNIFDGGAGGADVAGFARSYQTGIVARLGGKAVQRGVSNCAPTVVRGNNEVLEGTPLNDVLYARRNTDLLIGRGGKDRCVGGRHWTC